MISVVVWKWAAPDAYRPPYRAEHVNRLFKLVRERYARPFRFVCVTDSAAGLEPGIEPLRDWRDFADVASPHGAGAPSCYRRLRAFHPDAGLWFGDRFVVLDLDVAPVGDLVPLWDRPETFVIYRDPLYATQYNGSMWLLSAGARSEVWTDFAPRISRRLATESRKRGSDQGWISYRLPGEATWGAADGVLSYRQDVARRGGSLPHGARLVVFHGLPKPWDREPQRLAWVRERYGVSAA